MADFSDDYSIVPFVTPDDYWLSGSMYTSSAPTSHPNFFKSSWNGVQKFFGLNGKTTADTTGKPGKGLGEFGEAHSLAVSPKGEIFVADTVSGVLHKFVKK